jgi:hypothetical protein
VRIFGFVALFAALAVGAFLFASSSKQEGPTSSQAQTVEQQANAALGSANFQGAATQLEAEKATNGTYEGASLPPSFGVTLVRADASSYCIQTGTGSALEHETGPGGSPQPGPC